MHRRGRLQRCAVMSSCYSHVRDVVYSANETIVGVNRTLYAVCVPTSHDGLLAEVSPDLDLRLCDFVGKVLCTFQIAPFNLCNREAWIIRQVRRLESI